MVRAALAPIVGAGPVTEVLGRLASVASLEPADVNGHPALIVRIDGRIDNVIAVRIEGGLIAGLYAVRNPEKLAHFPNETALARS